MQRRIFLYALATICGFSVPEALAAGPAWKAGTAKVVITPSKPLWMAGYGGRTEPAEGKLHDLWLKVLALQDAAGNRTIVLSSDLLGIPKTIYDNTCVVAERRFGLERGAIMLTASHTHCGPVLRGALSDIYPLDDRQITLIEEYSAELEKNILWAIGEALGKLEPATVEAGEGTARFAVNRRNNREPEVPQIRAAGKELNGPIDHAVPVLAVRGGDGKLLAVVFGYACHNTTLSFQQWCGDYAGFAQREVESKHPGSLAMFYMGCGADQNPLPRRTVELCANYGRQLAAAVEDVLRKPMKRLQPRIRVAFEMVTLNLGAAPTRAELESIAGSSNYRSRWAKRLLDQLERGEPFFRTYPYPVQVWKLGEHQLWISLGGEVVVDYSLRFKTEIDSKAWVTGYANDVMAYIPSLRVLKEGGYEGASSMMVYGMPAHRWGEDVEDLIAASVHRLVKQLDGGQ